MGRYNFEGVEVVRDEKSNHVSSSGRCGVPKYGKRTVKSAYAKLWKLVLASTKKGKAVSYEEYHDNDGRLLCRGRIED